jgi:AcrR family transcriptional regulator
MKGENGDSAAPKISRRRTQGERSAAMKVRLLEAATEVLKERGYSGLRISEVAAAAGVSRGAHFHHYPTKEALATACFEHIYEQVRHAANDRIALKGEKVDDVIDGALADAKNFFLSDKYRILADILQSGEKDPKLARDLLDITVRYRESAEEAWIKRLEATGLKYSDAHAILWLLWNVVRGLGIRRGKDVDSLIEQEVTGLTASLLKEHARRVQV